MADAIDKAIKKLKLMKLSINKALQTSINTNKNVLIEQQTKGQFDKGKDANNVSFVPSYATSTIIAKRKKGQPTDRVTLKDTGKLYDSINIKAGTKDVTFSANVEYYKYLVAHYKSNQILGIQPKEMELFIKKYTTPEILKNFKAIAKK
jgi:hypothetical protein